MIGVHAVARRDLLYQDEVYLFDISVYIGKTIGMHFCSTQVIVQRQDPNWKLKDRHRTEGTSQYTVLTQSIC